MPEPDLDTLLKRWADAEAAGDVGRDCPRLSVLWYHETEGEPLGQHEEHVAKCPRCRKRLGLIRAEQMRAKGLRIAGLSVRAPLVWAGGVLAVAASITLVIGVWPAPSFDKPIAVFAHAAHHGLGSDATRGDGLASGERAETLPDWVTEVLADEQVQDAIATQRENEIVILLSLTSGTLTFDDQGHLAIAPAVDDATALAENLPGLIIRDRRATEQIVEVLLRHLPGASEKDRPAVQRAVDRWRAENWFGSHE